MAKIVYHTLQELLEELQSSARVDGSKRIYYNLFAIVTQVCGANFQTNFLVYRIKDETAIEAVLSLKSTHTPYPAIKTGDVVRLHRFAAHLYNGTIECNVFKPETVVVYPKNDENQVNPISVAKKPSSDPSDIVKVKDLFALNLSLPRGEPYSFSNVFDNGQETDIIAQLVGFVVLNNQRGAFAFIWDGTKCPVEPLKQFEGFRLDDRDNIRQCDPVLLNRSTGLLHHLFLFDNIAQSLQSMEPGSFLLLEGVRVAFKKNTKQLYLTCKGRIRQLNENDRNTVKLKERLSKVPIAPAFEESAGEESPIECLEGNNNDTEPANENQATNKDTEPKSSDKAPAIENQVTKSSKVMDKTKEVMATVISSVVPLVNLVDLISKTLGNQDGGTSLPTDTEKGISNNEPSTSVTSYKEQTLAVNVPNGVEDQMSINYIDSVARFTPNQDADTLVSVPSCSHQDVSNNVVRNEISESIPISRQNKKKRKVKGTFTLHGTTKKFYTIPQENLDLVFQYLEKYTEKESSDSSRYVTAESSPINTQISEMESQSSLVACVDSLESGTNSTDLRLESSSCSSACNLSNLSIISVQAQVGSQLELPETPECSHSGESQNWETTQSESLLQDLTRNYQKSNLASKVKDGAFFAQFNKTSSNVVSVEKADTRKRPYNTWEEGAECAGEKFINSKFDKAAARPFRRKKKNN